MNGKNRPETIHELRIGECFDGYLIGIAPPVGKKTQTSIFNFILKSLADTDNFEIESSTVVAEHRYNQWLIKGISEDSALKIAHQLIYTNEVEGVAVMPPDYKIRRDNQYSLFDQE